MYSLTDVLGSPIKIPFVHRNHAAKSPKPNNNASESAEYQPSVSEPEKFRTMEQMVRDSLTLLDGGSEPMLGLRIIEALDRYQPMYRRILDRETVATIIAGRVVEMYEYATLKQNNPT